MFQVLEAWLSVPGHPGRQQIQQGPDEACVAEGERVVRKEAPALGAGVD